ncbi:hypothetical protein NM688_g3602 [Phlebia brevispora]|uniref:Uncharacterized protein n=1 Tax=Phlebia brevispora TaxID=194682 RepID=A0ACC1T576_9APHY|nr:hypothetical protein NM688_g3602 [Phlebia brevispora]
MSVCNATRTFRAFRGFPLSTTRAFSSSPSVLSGHNKWSKIKATKGAMDAQKSALYARYYRDIIITVRETGNGDPETNASLAAALKRAKSAGVPKDNIEKALKKATGGKESGDQPVTYEAMGPGSVGIIIECLTNNPNRTFKFTRETLTKHGARLAPVSFLFQKKGVVRVAVEEGDDFDARLERLIDTALNARAEDFDLEGEPENGLKEIEFTCLPASLGKLTAAVTEQGLCKELVSSEMVYAPVDKPEPPDEETEEKIGKLVEALEGLEDTLRVTTTID